MSLDIVSTSSFVTCLPWVASKAFFYSRTPILVLERMGRVCGINAALRVLMGRDVAGSRGQGLEFLLSRLRPRLDGELFPAGGMARSRKPAPVAGRVRPMYDEVGVVEGRCRYQSLDFGLADLSAVEVPCLDTASGELVGSVLNVEVLSLEGADAYRTALLRRWSHEVMWEVYTSSYDRIIPELPFYKEVLGRHLAAMQRPGIDQVLDIGAGTGTVTVPLVREGKSVTAVNLHRAMLARLEDKLGGIPTPRLAIIEDTAESLPQLADASFDGVTALNSFFDMSDPHSALLEAVRMLRPWGTIVITDPRECFNADSLKAIAEQYLLELGIYDKLHDDWMRVLSVTPALAKTIASKRVPDGGLSPRAPWHAEAIYETLRGLEFEELSFEDAHEGHCATITGKKPQ